MTRDYNKPPRDDTRSPSRGQSPNRAGEERSPSPPRPRLNRETVDRAWESGAPAKHADYRTRSSNGQPPRWRNNQQPEHSPAQNGRRPYQPNGNQQGNQRSFERSPNENYTARPRSFDNGREKYDNQRSNGNVQPGNPNGFQKHGTRGGSYDNQQRPARDQRPPFRDSEHNQGYQGRRSEGQGQSQNQGQRDFERSSGPPRNFERDGGPPRSYERKPRDFEQGERSQRTYSNGNRPSYPAEQRDTQNPRWQSRPAARQNTSSQERPTIDGREAQSELFEGDYERFGTPGAQRSVRPGRPYRVGKTSSRIAPATRTKPEERYVTRLPDGRVLKGPRPVQRKSAQFWTGINSDTEGLLKQIETPEKSEALEAPGEMQTSAVQESPADGETEAKPARKPRSHAASAVARNKKDLKKEKVKKPRSSPGPRPSQHGYKWPSSE